MTSSTILLDVDARGTARLTLNRPDVHNAFDEHLIADLTAALARLDADPAVRIVVLAANGKSFSAGGDLDWMRRAAAFTRAENERDAMGLGALMRTLNFMAKPTIAAVQGGAFGGGVGLVACCDIAIASESAVFCLSEVKLGLLPAVVGPYVVAAIGARAARRYFQTAERFSAGEAYRLGLVHQVVLPADLDAAVARMVATLAEGGPGAQAASKRLIFDVAGRPIDDGVVALTARAIAERRATDEAKEGIGAFFERRKPNWTS